MKNAMPFLIAPKKSRHRKNPVAVLMWAMKHSLWRDVFVGTVFHGAEILAPFFVAGYNKIEVES